MHKIHKKVLNLLVLLFFLPVSSSAGHQFFVRYFEPSTYKLEVGTITQLDDGSSVLDGKSYEIEPISHVIYLCKNEVLVYFVNQSLTFLHIYVTGWVRSKQLTNGSK